MESIYTSFNKYREEVIILKGQSPRTEEGFLVSRGVITRFFDCKQTEDITVEDVRSLHTALNKKLKTNTIRGYLFHLKVALRYAKQRGLDVIDPESIIIPKRAQTAPEYFTPEEIDKIISQVKIRRGCNKLSVARDKAIISMLFASGMRASEMCSLNIRNWQDRKATVIGKGDKPRVVFWDMRTHNLLNEYMKLRNDNCPALFVSSQGKRLKRHSLVSIFIRLQNLTGISELHAHTLRHSYATDLVNNGMPIHTVQHLMGHENLSTTSRYLHIAYPQLQAEYERYHS